MKRHLFNAGYGLLDYAAYPIGMLLLAPLVLRRMGAAQYGIWTVVIAVVSMGSIVASGFGDANIQYVATARERGQHGNLLRAVRAMIAINLLLGTACALFTWIIAPVIARHVALGQPYLQSDCLWSLRLACVVMWVRAQESVPISTQRAFERYGAAVRLSIGARLLSLALAAALTCVTRRVAPLVAGTALITLLGTVFQFERLRRLLGCATLSPAFEGQALRALLAFGVFSWMQAISTIVFSQVDRLFLGISMGAAAVASYALCTQMAQPIYGFAAAGLHFLFPLLASRSVSHPPAHLRRIVLSALTVNLAFVASAAAVLLWVGPRLLRAWAGATVGESSSRLLPVVVAGSALLGLNITGTYALLALGRFRVVTGTNIAAGCVMLLLIVDPLGRNGARGMALARLCYGLVTMLIYAPLIRQLNRDCRQQLQPVSLQPAGEEA